MTMLCRHSERSAESTVDSSLRCAPFRMTVRRHHYERLFSVIPSTSEESIIVDSSLRSE
ncbi:MAG: hypothetical protein RMM16_11730 [Chloroherpetonaceae bacterium]|nr:hypothetical protein [Chloroherpetonaceae bacterium]